MNQTPKEKALEMLQNVGGATTFSRDNNGRSLSLDVAKVIVLQSLIWIVEACTPELHSYYVEVQKEVMNYE